MVGQDGEEDDREKESAGDSMEGLMRDDDKRVSVREQRPTQIR